MQVTQPAAVTSTSGTTGQGMRALAGALLTLPVKRAAALAVKLADLVVERHRRRTWTL
jgi:hypothetical protein